MAALASIPEGSTSLPRSRFSKLNREPHYIDNPRPRSRTFAASRRQTRVRYPPRSGSQRPNWPHPPHDDYAQLREAANSAAAINISANNFTATGTSVDSISHEAALLGLNPDHSDSSIDLDSFPLPPSTHTSSRPESSNQSAWLSASTSNARQSLSNPAAYGQVQRNSRIRVSTKRTHVDGADDATSRRTSVDAALVDAITRNILQQFQIISLDKHAHRRSSRQKQYGPPADRDQN